MQTYTNQSNIALSLAVYLSTDYYDKDSTSISATGLLNSVRQLVLQPRLPESLAVTDISNLIASRLGTSIHDGIERAWRTNHKQALRALGHPESFIERIVIDPNPEDLKKGDIPLYMEKRSYRECDGVMVSGKFDFILNGQVQDFKTQTAYRYKKKLTSDDFSYQGSIYRWLNPELITDDVMVIHPIIMDWSQAKTYEEGYPPNKLPSREIKLLSLEETEHFIKNKIKLVRSYVNSLEKDLPLCTAKELWQDPPTFKYYKDPAKRKRSTKNFTNPVDANLRRVKDGNVGIVVKTPAKAVACKYCDVFSLCTQKDDLIASGHLTL